MSNQANDKKAKESGSYTNFTVDAEGSGTTEMPSITRLLNRKALRVAEDKGGRSALFLSRTKAVQPPPVEGSIPPSKDVTAPTQITAPSISSDEDPLYFTREIRRPPRDMLGSSAPTNQSSSSAAAPFHPDPFVQNANESLQLEEAPIHSSTVIEDPSITLVHPDEFPKSASPTSSLPPEAEPAAPPPPDISKFVDQPAAAPATPQVISKPKVQAAVRRVEQRKASSLIHWPVSQLASSPDPLGKAVTTLLSQGLEMALFLAIVPPSSGSLVPAFNATATVEAGNRQVTWAGLKWDPALIPDLWNVFVKQGFVELPPPGTTTNLSSTRNVLRTAFGVGKDEWLTIVRVGPSDACRGVMALVSKKAIEPFVKAATPLFFANPQKSAA